MEEPKGRLGGAVFLRVEEFGKARILLEESEIFVVAGMVAIFGAKLDGDFEIGHGGIGFAGEAIKSGKSVVNVIGFGSSFARFDEAFAGIVPTPDVHHGNAALVVLVGRARILLGGWFHALFGDFKVHAGAVCEFLAGAFEDFFKFLLGAGEFLLVEKSQGFVIELELGLDAGIDQFNASALGRWRSS